MQIQDSCFAAELINLACAEWDLHTFLVWFRAATQQH